jgi:hypothetical protein
MKVGTLSDFGSLLLLVTITKQRLDLRYGYAPSFCLSHHPWTFHSLGVPLKCLGALCLGSLAFQSTLDCYDSFIAFWFAPIR